MNILIADDLQDNREALGRLIQQYARIYTTPCKVYEAENGKEALNICDEYTIDLIFMDIIMPIMDGLEATKIIKQKHPSVMIVVVSSQNDESIKKEILHNGAEDYVMKPLSSSIMLSRLNNYSKLINSRNTISFQPKAVNVFTHKIYSYQMKFFISNEDELAQFWETLLIRLEFNRYIDQINDLIRLFYSIANLQISKFYKCIIVLEEDIDNFYFTVNNIKLVDNDFIKKLIQKSNISIEYEIKDDLLSLVISRVKRESINVEDASKSVSKVETKTPVDSTTIAPVLKTYNILDEDDLEELGFAIDKLKTEINFMGSSDLTLEDIDTINTYIHKISIILSSSHDAYDISKSLEDFCSLLNKYSDEFLIQSKALADLMQSFINDVAMWRDMIFYTGAPSVDFLDNSIRSNIQMIRAVFIPDAGSENDLDDIFDF